MKILFNHKDGGLESKVWAYGLEIKSLFSVIFLRFENGSREAYHSHAFNCVNWVFSGALQEDLLKSHNRGKGVYYYFKSLKPFLILRDDLHKVSSTGRSWVLSLRGPWVRTWTEWVEGKGYRKLTHGRKIVND